jgi:hypothetical protein
VVVHTRSGPLGLAAYLDTPCDIRVVQEFLLDPALDVVSVGRVADLLLQTVERRATRCGASGLLVTVPAGYRLAPFERLGYAVVSQDGGVVWLQKALLIARRVGLSAPPQSRRH